MKTKKLIIAILVFAVIMITFAFINTSQAASLSSLGYLKITKDRESTVKFTAESQGQTVESQYKLTLRHRLYERDSADYKTINVWKIVTSKENGEITDTINDLYCLRAGLGFTSQEGSSANANPVLYNQAYDMPEDYESIRTDLGTLASPTTIFKEEKKDNFNAVMWILDNMLLEGATDEEVTAYLKDYAGYQDEDFNKEKYKANVLTRADIEAIQQLAIWYFTNDEEKEYHIENLDSFPAIYLDIDGFIYGTNDEYKTIESIFNTGVDLTGMTDAGTVRQAAAGKLFKKLVTDAKAVADGLKSLEDGNGIYVPTREITVYLAAEGKAANEQPVVYVREVKEEGDISLRKFVSAKNGEKLTGDDSREPEVDTSMLNKLDENGILQETAIYRHKKQPPVRVQVGDIVTYTLRIYNEGSIPARVHTIKDYLPPYIEYTAYGDDNGTYWLLDENGKLATSTPYCKVVNAGGELVYNDTDAENNVKGKLLSEVVIPAAKLNEDAEDNDPNTYTLSYVDIQISGKVMPTSPYETALTNIAEVAKMTDKDGKDLPDRDSFVDDMQQEGNIPDENELPNYVPKPGGRDQDINNPRIPGFVEGFYDDDDFDKVIVEQPTVDLSLRKFISAKNGDKLTGDDSREPIVDTTGLRQGTSDTAVYVHKKNTFSAKREDIITYTIRVYNEGSTNGMVKEITDNVAKQLKYVAYGNDSQGDMWTEDTTNPEYNVIKTTDKCKVVNAGGALVYNDTQAANNVKGKLLSEVVIPAYDSVNDVLSYVDVEINLQIQKVTSKLKLTNIAEISKEADETGREIESDRDSQPGNVDVPNHDKLPDYTPKPGGKDQDIDNPRIPGFVEGNQDDDDFEKVEIIPEFDLALRKFITRVENTAVNNRVPRPVYDAENDKLTYEHDKDPLEVKTGDTVIYTIRVYNEGEADGYANEVTDDLPEGLEFLVDNDINKEYRWVLLDENKEVTEDVTKAKYIVTDYLSEDQEKETGRDNKLDAFDKELGVTETNPDYRDVKVAFKVTFTATTKDDLARTLTNVAQISKDSSEEPGQDSKDKDSKPDKDTPYDKENEKNNEDDIDFEEVKVKYFDLSLLKWVSEARVTLNGKTEIVKGNTEQNSLNEPPLKLEVAEKDINKVSIKYVYTIKVTNEGELEGYASEVTDYIPAGLKFNKEDNTEWKWEAGENGTIKTTYLSETLLKPGESATIPLVLTWVNGKENFGSKINDAEISKHQNPSDSPDIDSTPNNKNPKEDDFDSAEVIITVKTGSARMYLGLTAIVLITFAGGIGLIKKYVLE